MTVEQIIALYGNYNLQYLQGRFHGIRRDENILTCEDFKDLGVECCDSCHSYAVYDMPLFKTTDDKWAFACDAIKWKLFPEEHQKLKEWGKSDDPRAKLLRQIFE